MSASIRVFLPLVEDIALISYHVENILYRALDLCGVFCLGVIKTLITYLNNKMASYSFENSDIDLHINNHISIFAHETTRGGKHHIYGKNFNTFSSTVDTLVYLESLQSNWDIPLNVLIFCCHADAIINDKHNYKFLKSGSTLSTYTSGKINIKKNYQLMTSIIQYSNNNKFLDVFFGALTPTGKDFKNLCVCNMEGKKKYFKIFS